METDIDDRAYENDLVCFRVHAPDHCYRVLGRVIYENRAHENVVVLFCHPFLVARVVDRLAQDDPSLRRLVARGVVDHADPRDDDDREDALVVDEQEPTTPLRHFCAVLPRSVCWVNNHTWTLRVAHAATTIQRAFRRYLQDRAARTIQLAYLAYTYAPPCGRMYRRLVARYAAVGAVGAG